MSQIKLFTVEEANSKIHWLGSLLAELLQKRDAIMHLEAEIDALELVVEAQQDGDSPAVHTRVDEYTRQVSRFYTVIDEIHQSGCLLKDLDAGLVDFYSLHEGRMVFLCWKKGEPEVAFWHEVNQGVADRQPLSRKN